MRHLSYMFHEGRVCMIRVGGGECSTSESLREQVGGNLAIEKDAVHKDGKLL